MDERDYNAMDDIDEEEESSEVALDNWAIPNDEDTADLADEIGVSGIFDPYGREVLKNVFENRLRLAPDSVKLMYSRLKNQILSYEEVTRKYDGQNERFYVDDEEIFNFAVDWSELLFTVFEDETIGLDLAKGQKAFDSALRLIDKTALKLRLDKKDDFQPVAYAERYQFNPDAVLRGEEEEEPLEGAFDGEEYYPIEGELSGEPLKKLFETKQKTDTTEDTFVQKVTSTSAAAALSEPIVYFFNVARTSENGIGYLTVQQVLNDKFLGKMLPQQFFAVAEGGDRIIPLNLLSVKQAADECNKRPNTTFVTQASARLLTPDSTLQRLIKAAHTENGNLVLAFDSALLEALGNKGLAAIRTLADSGVKIMLDNTESAGLKVLTEYPVDYLRFDGRYYKEEDEKKIHHFDMVMGYAKVQGINTSALYVDTMASCRFFLAKGINNIEGDVVGPPVRVVEAAVKQARKLPEK